MKIFMAIIQSDLYRCSEVSISKYIPMLDHWTQAKNIMSLKTLLGCNTVTNLGENCWMFLFFKTKSAYPSTKKNK